MISGQDKKYIEYCFKLAINGKGKVSPNPLVGAVIVKNGEIISEGWHAEYGKDHAEAMAIKNAKQDLSGATLYCNLEPCIHTNKKTPPCYPLIIKSGIKRVVISNLDPNPKVAGTSVQQLHKQGIKIETGVLEEKGWELNRFFFKHIIQKRPWVTLKIAQSIDGKISKNRNKQTWLTGKESKEFVHGLRAEYDAVLVGSHTVNVDNPQLSVREVEGRDPLKIIISGSLNVNPDSIVMQHREKEKVWVFYDENLTQSKRDAFNKNIRYIGLPADEERRIEIDSLLKFLYKENIGSLLVEGGQNIFSHFLQNDYCDELIIIQAPIIIGNGLHSVRLDSAREFELSYIKKLGHDICLNLRKKETN